ncbi:MAG: efflux RND transporter periplasmic adaptor subunit [Labrys sp. (in: a-proteobacteria)]
MNITARGWIGWGVAALIVGAIVWSLMPQPIPVELADVQRGRFVATIDETGRTRIRDRYLVSAPLGGQLDRMRLNPGDAVRAGDRLATIHPAPAPLLDARSRVAAQERVGAAEAALEGATTLVDGARAQDGQADQDLTRIRRLRDDGAATAQQFERAELAKRLTERDLRASEFQLDAARHDLDQARALLARYADGSDAAQESFPVDAPISGVVLAVIQQSEATVQPGTPLVEIGDRRDLEIVVDVLSTDAVEIGAGGDVIIDQWGGATPLEGRVRLVEPAAFTKISTLGVEEQRVNVLIDVVSPAPLWAGLGDGYQAETRIVVFAVEEATIVPSGALFRLGETWHVFMVEDGKARLRPVEVLRRSGRTAAITSGVGPGDRVIVYPSDRVRDGVRVAVGG